MKYTPLLNIYATDSFEEPKSMRFHTRFMKDIQKAQKRMRASNESECIRILAEERLTQMQDD